MGHCLSTALGVCPWAQCVDHTVGTAEWSNLFARVDQNAVSCTRSVVLLLEGETWEPRVFSPIRGEPHWTSILIPDFRNHVLVDVPQVLLYRCSFIQIRLPFSNVNK